MIKRIYNMKSIIVVLGSVLKVYALSPDSSIQELGELLPNNGGKYLNISDRFELFWLELELRIQSDDEMYFLVRDNASFTDSRVVYLWLKGQHVFDHNPYYVAKIKEGDWDIESAESINRVLSTAKSHNNQTLEYAREPNIGAKT